MKKSDFEINKAVAENCGKKFLTLVNGEVRIRGYKFDPCNNPADAMSIINEYGISLIKEDDHYIGASELMPYGLGWLSKDKNPYRAAMICFLMMKDAEK